MTIAHLLLSFLAAGCAATEASGDMPGMPGMAAPSTSEATPPTSKVETAIAPSTAATAIMGLTVAPVRAGVGQVARRAPATVSFDPTASVRVTTQSGGQVRSLAVPATGEAVVRGQVLARIYDPALIATLEEVRVALSLGEPWRSAAAARARASGIDEADVRAVEAGKPVPGTFPIRSPIDGVVSSRPVAEGTWVAAGGIIATLVDPRSVLVELVVDGAVPALGTSVLLRHPGGGSPTVSGTVATVLPEATAAGIRVRVQPHGAVTTGRPLVAEWTEVTAPSLWVPTAALVDTGTRKVVFVKTDAGFVPRPVTRGVRAGGEIELLGGVAAGESVAASAAFLLDSETQIGTMGHAGHGSK